MSLEKIVALKQQEVKHLYSLYHQLDLFSSKVERSTRSTFQQRSFSIIAEIKPASPSKGLIRANVDPIQQAKLYEAGGASVISILTEVSYFQGNPAWIKQVKEQVSVPILRKDFLIDPIQVIESKILGADVILLIAGLLTPSQITEMIQMAHDIGLEVLLEIHDHAELKVAITSRADLIGVNNRNLHTFHTDLQVSEQLIPIFRKEVDQPIISESGIHSLADVQRVQSAGANGILVGEYLMRQSNPEKALQAFLLEQGD